MKKIILALVVVASVSLLSSCGGCNNVPTDGCCGATSSGIWY